MFLCSPNNPTGNGWSVAELEAVLAAGVPTVVDQAYLECGHAESFAPLVARHPNLVVTRTFSKAFELAALRIGYGVMHPDLADAALRLRIPFSLGLPALQAAAAALADPADIEARRDFISGERERCSPWPSWYGVDPYPSEGNFILMSVAASGRTNDEIIRLAHEEDPPAGHGLAPPARHPRAGHHRTGRAERPLPRPVRAPVRMTDRFVVAFDVGTSGVKAVLADLGGQVAASRYERWPVGAGRGRVEQDGTRSSTGSATPAGLCLERAGVAPGQVEAVSVTAQMFNVVPVGADGAPLTPMLSWLDTRAAPQAAAWPRPWGRTSSSAGWARPSPPRTSCPGSCGWSRPRRCGPGPASCWTARRRWSGC